MAVSLEDLSVAEIQQLLKKKQGRVAQLQKRRVKLLEEIKNIDAEITELSGESSGTRYSNTYTNLGVACHVLGKYKKGLTLAELADAILKTGHRSTSNNFNNTIYQAIHNSDLIKRDEKTKKYMLKK